MIYILVFLCSFVYSQCDTYNESDCITNLNCEWIENISQGNCYYGFNNYAECVANGCLWYNPGTYGYMGSHCYGGTYEIDESFCQEILLPECSEMNVFECNQDENCEWIEDIVYGNCSSLNEDQCDANPNCVYDCGMYHGSCAGCCWGDCLGGAYELDNSYCEDTLTETVDCSELNVLLCNDNNYAEECEWIEQTSYIDCNTLSDSECTSFNVDAIGTGCWLQQGECLQWGSWYTWLCYEYDYQCTGGTIEVNTSYCEEIEYEPGDINGDSIINVLDAIEIINIILNAEYNIAADLDNDNSISILDVIMLVNIILNS